MCTTTTLDGSSQNMVEYYSKYSQKLLPGLNILVKLYYHHTVEEYNSYSEFETSKSTRTTMASVGSRQKMVEYYSNDSQKLLPGLNILVQLYYQHIVKENNSYSKF